MSLNDFEAVQADFARIVVAWQRHHGRRDLPWQATQDPYRVWLSEVMLQQTQVSTVLGYYARFLQRWPTVGDLAQASLDEVLAQWAGLGYYSRARNLHACAQAVVHTHGGAFPRSAQALAELPGIGATTAAAIAAFCFGERVAIFDGNVRRVLARLLAFEGDLSRSAAEKALWAKAQALLPRADEVARGAQGAADIAAYTQGLMDLGALICTPRKPDCAACPVQGLCAAYAASDVLRYPIKTRRIKRSRKESWWLLSEQGGRILLQQRPAQGVWAGLWTLPIFDDERAAQAAAGVQKLEPLARIEHALTHFDWVLHTARVAAPLPLDSGVWVAREELAQYALPAPLKKLLG